MTLLLPAWRACRSRSLTRFCAWPLKLNWCLDWDIDGTRWSRVGFTLAQV